MSKDGERVHNHNGLPLKMHMLTLKQLFLLTTPLLSPSMYQLVLENVLVTVCSPPEHPPHLDFHPQIVYQHEVKLVNTKLFFNLNIIELRIHTAKTLSLSDFQVQSPPKGCLF